jgi:pimeloyl-ACP methyl ester carboxylesterase
MTASTPAYLERRQSRSEFVELRGLRHHLHVWDGRQPVSDTRPLLVMVHGWMDVGASFQFVVDALTQPRRVVAPDWRGFGLTDSVAADSYWQADYLADLDALLDRLSPDRPVDLVGHSMGANVAMLYAGVRPHRVRRLVSLEGFGMPATQPGAAPARYAQWLDELKRPMTLSDYPSAEAVAERLKKTNPLLRDDRAAWLATHWARPDAQGRWQILGDPAHKRTNPVQYQKDEAMACWARITAPLMWVEGAETRVLDKWADRYSAAEFHERFKAVTAPVEKHVLSPAGHMLHHDQPEALAALLEAFLARPFPAADAPTAAAAPRP